MLAKGYEKRHKLRHIISPIENVVFENNMDIAQTEAPSFDNRQFVR